MQNGSTDIKMNHSDHDNFQLATAHSPFWILGHTELGLLQHCLLTECIQAKFCDAL